MDPVRPRAPRFRVVSDESYDCPYLPGQTAHTPLRLPSSRLLPLEFDELLAQGDRRAGVLLYRTECASCHACEPLRLPVAEFQPTKSQRRSQRKNEDVRLVVGPPRATPDRLALYNRHRLERGLAKSPDPIGHDEYRFQYVSSCVDTREVDYLVGDRLIAFSILDVGAQAASSVYHCFDPDESRRSMGVFSVLAELELCREWGLDWYYLGLWAGECDSLRYKTSYHPHERLRDGVWHRYEEAE